MSDPQCVILLRIDIIAAKKTEKGQYDEQFFYHQKYLTNKCGKDNSLFSNFVFLQQIFWHGEY